MTAGKAKWGCLGLVAWVVLSGWEGGLAKAKKRQCPEINYAARFCIAEGGTLEKSLEGKHIHIPDCSTDTHVIEADFGDKADKPGEGVDQVKRYMDHDPEKRKGGILLILEKENDKKRYIQKLCEVMAEKQVTADIWIMYSDFTYRSYQCNEGKFGTPKQGRPLPRCAVG